GLLRSTLVTSSRDDPSLLEALLEICDSFMTYRRRYLATLQPAPVLDLLLADETNPRSLTFQMVALNDHVESLPRDKNVPQLSPEERLSIANLSMLRLSEVGMLCQADGDGRLVRLDETLARVDADM